PYSILFRGCSFMIVYQAGVLSALRELSPDIMKSAYRIYGASSGSIVATAALCGCDLGKGYRYLYILGLKRWNTWEFWRCRIFCIIINEPPLPQVTVSVALCSPLSFPSHPQAMTCSCFVPLYFGLLPPTFRGVRYVDGELAMWRADFVCRSTITISAFAGEYDICPKDGPAAFLTFQLSDCILYISKMNICRLQHI
ncbi:PLPL1 protein, partial [Quiscalus mexicanus]|nr:PLPL1 protein [Quiscalus mexicanus]